MLSHNSAPIIETPALVLINANCSLPNLSPSFSYINTWPDFPFTAPITTIDESAPRIMTNR